MGEYTRYELPDGRIVEYPSSWTREQSLAKINKDFPRENLMQKVKRYGLKDIGAGAAQTARNAAGVGNFVSRAVGSNVRIPKTDISDEQIYNYFGLPPEEEQNIGDKIAQMIPEVAGSFLVPEMGLGKAGQYINKIPGAGKYLNKILANAIPQGVYSGAVAPTGQREQSAELAALMSSPFSTASVLAQSTKPQYQKAASILGGGAAAGLTSLGLGQMGVPGYISGPASAAAAILGGKGLGTEAMMKQRLAGGKDLPKAQERLKMAKRLGLDFLTPEEAFNSPFLARKQGQLGRTEAGSELLYEKFGKRIESEQKSINRLLKQIHDPDVMGPKATELYKKAYETVVPQDVMNKIADNKVIHEAIGKVQGSSAYQHSLKNTPTNSIAYLDHVKQAMDDMIQGAPDKEAKIIRSVKNDLVSDLDKLSPEYKQARALEERKFVRRDLESAFDKTNINSGHAFYKAINDKPKFEKLMHNLRDVPLARKKLEYMRELFKDFRKESTINKVRGLEQVGMKQGRNPLDAIIPMFEDLFVNGKFDVQGINFITDPNWDKKIAQVNKISDGQKKAAKFIELFGKGASQAVASGARNED